MLIFAAGPASAHVGLDPTTTGAGEGATLEFSFGHGCDGSPTERLEIQLPEEVLTAAPVVGGPWSIDVNTSELDEPVEHGHSEITERVDSVVFTADEPIDDSYRGVAEMRITIPDVDPGTLLEFPTVQSCTEGETGWVQSSVDETEPDFPAPAFEVTAGSDDDVHSEDGSDADAQSSQTRDADSSSDDSDSNAVAWVGAGLGAAGLLAGGVALARRPS